MTVAKSPAEQVSPTNLDPVLVMTGVTKVYPGVRALDAISFDVRPGEVHALVGENGSGKSTLIKSASGVLTPEEGTVLIGGTALAGSGVRRARQLGLMVAYQDTSLVEDLTVRQNVELSFHSVGETPPDDLDGLLARFDLPFGTGDTVRALGPGSRQLLEVAKAMAHNPLVLMLDEPTAALDMQYAEHLDGLVRASRDDGTAIVYVSHRLPEVRRLADRVTVIRDGVIQGTFDSGKWEVDDIVEMMVGAPTALEFPTRATRDGAAPERLKVFGLAGPGYGPIDISVEAGEIVGIAGAEGNGQREVLRGMIGIGRDKGDVSVDGAPIKRLSPPSALDAGISFQSGDRAAESVFLPLSVMANATTQLGSDAGPFGLALPGRLHSEFESAQASLGIVAASAHQPISALSGGNAQKAVLARAALRQVKVLMLDEPTQGVDAKARLDIYSLIADTADSGVAVVINSSDSSELAGLCDRVIVMSKGVAIEELRAPTTEAAIVRSFVGAVDVDEETVSLPIGPSWLGRALGRVSGQIPVAMLLVLLALVSFYTGTQSEIFWTPQNLANWLLLTLPLAFVALGQQYVMVSGGLDISVGSTMSLTVVICSLVLPDLSPGTLLVAVPVLLLAALVIGCLNAFLIERLKVNAIVATVATMAIIAGLAIVLRPKPEGSIAPGLNQMFSLGIGFIPAPFIVLVAIALGAEWWLQRRPAGLALRATGFDMESSRRVGQSVTRVRTVGLLVCSFGAVVGGIFLASQTGIGSNSVGAGYTLTCFAAVFLGGAVLTGGRGSFIGALLGALFLSLLNNVTPLLNIPDSTRQTIYGFILLIAVGTYAYAQRGRRRAEA
ncbi:MULTISPECIES: ATP-binding cassette domain-containing protein [unclassified Rhodococcus (in: high G+C Gram-positive bacteria)]|uniref:ATP-binding cassette domain-containing protein n=1 Tax=unclassified Rhodococcus (in: high G+C Gram-positive bacteria) TaxID=192944 RepID=UPI000B076BCA|nr:MULTISPECIES: ATP-binding cassette domain-containing protein [unclassified Rhodococcus (in: high G+C Gram-positive bacteria)]